ncbi:unnamed protein product [Vicia faba]|uniref:Ubiquitin-like protease family profile domain-containing protein n=1 Tax=Vicia faba TaxID=3906 RepID=A0AAV1AMG1_VICFA|nr:unnamed protein product [Vicia faba]
MIIFILVHIFWPLTAKNLNTSFVRFIDNPIFHRFSQPTPVLPSFHRFTTVSLLRFIDSPPFHRKERTNKIHSSATDSPSFGSAWYTKYRAVVCLVDQLYSPSYPHMYQREDNLENAIAKILLKDEEFKDKMILTSCNLGCRKHWAFFIINSDAEVIYYMDPLNALCKFIVLIVILKCLKCLSQRKSQSKKSSVTVKLIALSVDIL